MAKGNANPNESATALRQAQFLMRAHKITPAEIEASEITERRSSCGAKKIYPQWLSNLACAIAQGFDCQAFFSGHSVIFIGYEQDVTLSKYAFDVLHRQVKNARKSYIDRIKTGGLFPTLPSNHRAAADAYCIGWVNQAISLIANIAINPDKSRKINTYIEHVYGVSETSAAKTRASKGHDDAYYRGKEDGKKAVLNRGVDGYEVQKIGGVL